MVAQRLLFALRVGLAGLAAVVALGCSNKTDDRDVLNVSISMSDLSKVVSDRDKDVLIIDARTAKAFGEGHIPGARNIRLDTIDAKERDPALDRYKTIIVYGETPGPTIERSTAKRLIQAKYDDVRWFEDGFKAWVASGLPVTRPEPGATPEKPAPAPAPARK